MELLVDQYSLFCRDSKFVSSELYFFTAKQTEMRKFRKENSICSIFDLHVY